MQFTHSNILSYKRITSSDENGLRQSEKSNAKSGSDLIDVKLATRIAANSTVWLDLKQKGQNSWLRFTKFETLLCLTSIDNEKQKSGES
jgi:hypothetical protein